MRHLSMAVALLLASLTPSAQTAGVLRISVMLPDETQKAVPIAKHALLISDNPPTREPRRVVTGVDGSVEINLAPGSYIVESERAAAFLGKGYEWATIVDVPAGRETTLALTGDNASIVPVTATLPETVASADPDVASQIAKWRTSVVTIWSPTAQASGFVVDDRGLLATDRNVVGNATSVEVQLSSSLKVPAQVLVANPAQDVAIVWMDPAVLEAASPVPLTCPPPAATSVDDGDDIVAITAAPDGRREVVTAEVTGFHPRGIETDLRLAFGETGGPVFAADDAGLVGVTAIRTDENAAQGDARVVRAGILCDALAAAREKMSGTPPPPTRLPVEPSRGFPAEAKPVQAESGVPPVIVSSNFEVALITPPTLLRARERADWTGGKSGRTPEAEARLGRLTEFGPWSRYFADRPAVLVIRVTPKLVEGFWMRLAREAARTQGAALPALKDFRTNFLRLRATCGANEVLPIHPFVLEHAVGEKRVLREGLYVFGPDALGPHCGTVTLSIVSEQTPEKPEDLTIDAKLLEWMWREFEGLRQGA